MYSILTQHGEIYFQIFDVSHVWWRIALNVRLSYPSPITWIINGVNYDQTFSVPSYLTPLNLDTIKSSLFFHSSTGASAELGWQWLQLGTSCSIISHCLRYDQCVHSQYCRLHYSSDKYFHTKEFKCGLSSSSILCFINQKDVNNNATNFLLATWLAWTPKELLSKNNILYIWSMCKSE